MGILAIGIDSLDTAFAGCTTHAASIAVLQLLREGFELADYPWLVRLNPAAPWKTRGNGAVALLLYAETRSEAEKAASLAVRVARAYAAARPGKASLHAIYLHEANSLDDYMRMRPRCLETLYWRALHELVAPRLALTCLREARLRGQAEYIAEEGAGRRGAVGAIAALGYTPLGDYTFELLTYRKPAYWARRRNIDPESVIEFDIASRPETFMNYDYELDAPLVAPHGYDPVLYGVRGETPEAVHASLHAIDTGGEEPSHWLIYRSNQATGHHLRPKTVKATRPYDNPLLYLSLEERPRRLSGGHVIAKARDHTGTIFVAAYREALHLREELLALEAGDYFVAGGQAKQREGLLTLNLELLYVPGREPVGVFRRCGAVQPPLSRLHHLAVPYQRCGRPVGGKSLRSARRLLLPSPDEFTLE